jgi:hypothetical protein
MIDPADASARDPAPANALDLGNEPGYLPERQVVRFVGAPGAELIVADDAKPLAGKIEKRRQVFGVATRAAVEQQQRPVTRARRLIPDAAIADVDIPFLTHIHMVSKFPYPTAGPAAEPDPLNAAGPLRFCRHEIATE